MELNLPNQAVHLSQEAQCKGGYENHVVLALIVNKNGLPFYWEVLPGCTADSTTINWLLESLKNKFNLKKILIITDFGEEVPFLS